MVDLRFSIDFIIVTLALQSNNSGQVGHGKLKLINQLIIICYFQNSINDIISCVFCVLIYLLKKIF